MEAGEEKICPQCRRRNPADSFYCWYCGAPLRGLLLGSGRKFSAGRLLLRFSRWLIALAVLAGIGFGAYYALDRLVWPAVTRHNAEEETSLPTVTTLAAASTTTTTTIPRVDRLVGGGSRYATAIAVSQVAFPAGAPALILVAGEDPASALAVAPLAAAYGAPILLLPPEGLEAGLNTEIARLGPQDVFLVGVDQPKTVQRQLGQLLDSPKVTALTGADPYETAANIASQIKTKLGKVTRVVVAPADSFLEAVAVGPLAAAQGWPILLTPADGDLPEATSNALADLAVESALVIGSTVELTTITDVERKVGADAFETALLVVEYALAEGASFEHTAIVTGDSFPDGLVTSALLAPDGGVLLFTKTGRLPAAMRSLFDDNRSAIRKLDFIALPDLARSLAQTAGGTGSTGTTSTGTATTE